MTHTDENEGLMIAVTPSSPYALTNGETHLYIQLKLMGVEIPVSKTRPNLNLGVVLDRSGSMQGSKLHKAKEAVQFVVENLSKDDVFALTVYDHMVETIVSSAKLTNRSSIINSLRSVRSRGRTNLHGGIIEGAKQVESAKPFEYRNVVLLLSDGLANEGLTDRNRIRDSIAHIYERGIGISTFGVGEDFDEDLMINIADAAGGSFYFIETADDIPRFIETEFKGLLQTIAYNIEVKWAFQEGIRIRRVLGVPYEDRRSNQTKLGDLRSGNELLVIFDVTVPPAATEDTEIEIMNFTFCWIPQSGPTEPVQYKVPCTITYTINESLLATEDDQVLENVHILNAAAVQYEAMEMADQGNFLGAQHAMQMFQEKLGQRVAQTGSPNLMKLQEQSAQILNDVLSEDQYSKSSRKKLRSTMYDLRKRR